MVHIRLPGLVREKLGAKRKEEFKKELAAKRRQLTQAQRRIELLTDCSSGFMRTIFRARSMTAAFKSCLLITRRSKQN